MEEDNQSQDLRDILNNLNNQQKDGNDQKEAEASAKLLTSRRSPIASCEVLNEDEWEDYIPQPPDGGWGWVIVIASFFNNFILDGAAYSFGIFLTEYVVYFETNVANASVASALLCGVYLLVGPLVGALVNKYGCRLVGIVGSIIAAVAFVLSTFSGSIATFQVTYGIMGGVGLGMMYLPAVVGVGFYFERKRALATGIAVCGTGIGTLVMAPFAKYLLNHLDWKNTHYVYAGLLLQGCLFSALMRPLKAKRRLPKTDGTTPACVVLIDKRHNELSPDSDEKSTLHITLTQSKSRDLAQSSSVLHNSGKSHHPPRLHSSALIVSATKTPSEIMHDLSRPLYKRDIFLSGMIPHEERNPSEVDINHESSRRKSIAVSEPHLHRLSCLNKLPQPVADVLAEMLDPSLLKNKGMLILCLANFFGMMGFYVPIIFSTNRAVELGVDEGKAALLLSIMGMCNTVGRVLSGAIAYIPSISVLLVNNICVTLAGVAVLLTPFCTTYISMVMIIAAYGLFASTFISLCSVIVCELVGMEKLTNGFGLICLLRGIAAIVAPPLEGMLFDLTGNYDATFYMGGASILVSALLHFMLFFIPRKHRQQGKSKN